MKLYSNTIVVAIRAVELDTERLKHEQKKAIEADDDDLVAEYDMRILDVSKAAIALRKAYDECLEIEGGLDPYDVVLGERN